ncbi:MAG: sarcosine oxidase subunit gamma, partial [Primorskyibacter sp.]
RGAMWMSLDELLITCAYAEASGLAAQMATGLADTHALAVDVSDARAVFVLTGAGVRDIIAKLAPVDMAVGHFNAGDVRRTRFGQIAAAFWMVSDTEVRIICFRSVAEYMFDMLCHAADSDGAIAVL